MVVSWLFRNSHFISTKHGSKLTFQKFCLQTLITAKILNSLLISSKVCFVAILGTRFGRELSFEQIYSELQIGWHRISRLFLNNLNLVPGVPGLYWDLSCVLWYYLVLLVKPTGRMLVRCIFFRNNLKILCHPICNRLNLQMRQKSAHFKISSHFKIWCRK